MIHLFHLFLLGLVGCLTTPSVETQEIEDTGADVRSLVPDVRGPQDVAEVFDISDVNKAEDVTNLPDLPTAPLITSIRSSLFAVRNGPISFASPTENVVPFLSVVSALGPDRAAAASVRPSPTGFVVDTEPNTDSLFAVTLVEFNPERVAVTAVPFSLTEAETVLDVAIDPETTFLVYNHESGGSLGRSIDLTFSVSGGNVVARRQTSVATFSGILYVVESLDGSFTVDHESFAMPEGQNRLSIPFTAPEKQHMILWGQLNRGTFVSSSPVVCFSEGEVVCSRTSAGRESELDLQVVSWDVPTTHHAMRIPQMQMDMIPADFDREIAIIGSLGIGGRVLVGPNENTGLYYAGVLISADQIVLSHSLTIDATVPVQKLEIFAGED